MKRNAYTLIKNVQNLKQRINASYFKKSVITDNGQKLLFDDMNNIHFYKLTRLPRVGEVMKKYDLRPKLLVRMGQKVKVQVKNAHVQLTTMAVAKKNGLLGQTIELMNVKSKKLMTAKVVGENKVEVNL